MDLIDDPWNRFVLRATDQAPQFETEQALYALFWYQAEVQNGGHLQYFLNRQDQTEWYMAIQVARELKQLRLAENLERAIEKWTRCERKDPETIDEFVAEAREEELLENDRLFYRLDHDLITAFQSVLD